MQVATVRGTKFAVATDSGTGPPRPMKVLLRYRAAMRELRGRLGALRRDYRRLPAEKLRELRRRRREPARE